MCTMKIVAKLISFEQIQPSKNLILETIKLLFYNTKKKWNMKTKTKTCLRIYIKRKATYVGRRIKSSILEK